MALNILKCNYLTPLRFKGLSKIGHFFVYKLRQICYRTVCGRRVRVEHALQSGAKKDYKSNIPSRYDQRYALLITCRPVDCTGDWCVVHVIGLCPVLV